MSTKVQGIPPAVDQALLRALAKTPAERFGSIEQFVAALGGHAVQAEAGDIVRTLMGRADALPPIPERAPARPGGSSRPKSSKPSQPVVVDRPAGVRADAPFAVMGVAVGIAVAVGTFIMLDQNPLKPAAPPPVAQAPSDTVVASLPPTTPAAPPLAAPPPSVALPKPAEVPALQPAPPAPQSVPQKDSGIATAAPSVPSLPAPRLAPSPSPPPPPSASARGPEGAQPSRPGRTADELAQKPNLEFAPSTGNEPTVEHLESFAATPGKSGPVKLPQKPAHRMPKEQPTYQGKVEDWIAGNLLFVQSPTGGVKKVDLSLYGIVGKDGNAKEAADVRKALEAYAKGQSHQVLAAF